MTTGATLKWHEQPYARAAYELADKSFIRSLRIYSARIVILRTAWLWAQLALAWSLLFTNGWLAVLSVVILIAAQQTMATWVHEASHFTLFASKRTNDLWCNLFFGAPLGMYLQTYRYNHMSHHTYLSAEEDRDRHVHGVDLTGRRFWIELAKALVCWHGLKVAVEKYSPVRLGGAGTEALPKPGLFFLSAVTLWNGLFLWVCIAAGYWYLYFALWVYPLLGVAQFINIVRTSAEHQPLGYPGVALEEDPLVRTTLPNAFEKWLMYGINFNYHIEHHLWASVPFFNLPKLHRHLIERGFYARHPELLQTSGIRTVWQRTRRDIAVP